MTNVGGEWSKGEFATTGERSSTAVTVSEVPFDRVKRFKAQAARERSSVTNTRGTRWFVVTASGLDFGCAGLTLLGSGGMRIKGVFVMPPQRGHGTGALIAERLLEVAQDECAPFIEAYAWNSKFYVGMRFKVVGKNAHGARLMRRVL